MRWLEILTLIDHSSEVLCSLAQGTSILVPNVVARYLKPNDLISVDVTNSRSLQPILIDRRSRRAASDELCFANLHQAARSQSSKSGFRFELPLSSSKMPMQLHLSNVAVREHFYILVGEESPRAGLYETLSSHPLATLTELRLAWRLRMVEVSLSGDARTARNRVERAFNILANPSLKECYDRLRLNEDALPLFPYGGYGSILVEGRLIEDGKAFIGNRILAFKPDMAERKVSILLRSCEFLPDRIVCLDSRRKLEVWLDGGLLPGLNWDPTWNNWKDWIRSRLEVEATFVISPKERLEKGERIVNKWSVALPSRLRVAVPEGLAADIARARAFHALIGRHVDLIRQIAAQIESHPAEHYLVEKWFRDFNAEPQLRPQHVNWLPDYDEFYFEELRKRSKTWFLFRGEYLFGWHKILIAEIPALGHATYIFSRPENLEEFMAEYARTEREDLRCNRNDVASRLGFIGRVVRGQRKMRWLNDVLTRAGEQVEVGDIGASG